jgi:T5orf172 domain
MLIPAHDFSVDNTPFPAWTRCQPIDPGWLYIVQNGQLLKVGKTTNPKRRLREAQTWLPEGEVIGIKPFWNIHVYERTLLCGIANYWLEGEWHRFPDEGHSGFLISGFRLFDDHDRNKNTVDFSYWIGGSGMGELIMEQNHRRISLRQWQRRA